MLSRDVSEILPLPRLSRWPDLPRVVEGFFNLGGDAVAAINADILFGVEAADRPEDNDFYYRHLIMLRNPRGQHVALVVDRVLDAIGIDSEAIMPVGASLSLNGCVTGEVDLDGEILHVLDANAIFIAEEQAALRELGDYARSRVAAWQGGGSQ